MQQLQKNTHHPVEMKPRKKNLRDEVSLFTAMFDVYFTVHGYHIINNTLADQMLCLF